MVNSAPALVRVLERERTAVGLDDPEAHREPDPDTDARGLGGEIGLEDARAYRLRDPRTVVGDHDVDGIGAEVEAAIARRMPEVCARIDALWADPTPAHDYARIDVPVWLHQHGHRFWSALFQHNRRQQHGQRC